MPSSANPRSASSEPNRSADVTGANAPRSSPMTASLGQVDADDLLVVADVHPPVGERRHRPDDRPARGRVGRLQDRGAVDLLVLRRRQPGYYQFSLLVEEEVAVAVADEERGAGVERLRADRGRR